MRLVLALEQVPDRDMADDKPTLCKFVCKGADRDIGLFANAAQYPVALIFQDRPTMTTDLARGGATRLAIAPHQLDCRGLADTEPLSS